METDSFPFKLTNNYYHLKRWLGKRIQDRWYYPPKRLLGNRRWKRRPEGEFLISNFFSFFYRSRFLKSDKTPYKSWIINFDIKLLLNFIWIHVGRRVEMKSILSKKKIDSLLVDKRGWNERMLRAVGIGSGKRFLGNRKAKVQKSGARWWMKNHLEKKQQGLAGRTINYDKRGRGLASSI